MIQKLLSDLQRGAAANQKYVAPILRHLYGADAVIVPTDKHRSPIETVLDQFNGIDGIIASRKYPLTPYSARIQFGRDFKSYSIRTLRLDKDGKPTPTELQKHCSAIDADQIRPKLTFQGFVDDDGNAHVGACLSDKLFNYVRKNFDKLKEITNRDGKTKFISVAWRDLRRVGIKLREFVVTAGGDVTELN